MREVRPLARIAATLPLVASSGASLADQGTSDTTFSGSGRIAFHAA
jgi:hypothetical protein